MIYPYRTGSLAELYVDVRSDLGEKFGFPQSTACVYPLDTDALRRGDRPPQELQTMMEAAGFDIEHMVQVVELFARGLYGGSCFNTGRKYQSMDYVVVIPERCRPLDKCQMVGESVSQGEHFTLHTGDGDVYGSRFQPLAVKFIGSLGHLRVSKRIAELNGHGLNIMPSCAEVDAGGRIFINVSDAAGMQLAAQLPETAPLEEMFHAPDKAALWEIYNEHVPEPVIEIHLPPGGKRCMDDVRDRFDREFGDGQLACVLRINTHE